MIKCSFLSQSKILFKSFSLETDQLFGNRYVILCNIKYYSMFFFWGVSRHMTSYVCSTIETVFCSISDGSGQGQKPTIFSKGIIVALAAKAQLFGRYILLSKFQHFFVKCKAQNLVSIYCLYCPAFLTVSKYILP